MATTQVLPQEKTAVGGNMPEKKAHRLHHTRIDMPEATRQKLVACLNQSLAGLFDLCSQVKQAHWNVKGKDFYQLHLLFDELAEELEKSVDVIAERVTALGGTAMGTARMAVQASILPEYPHDITEGLAHVLALAERYAMLGKQMRENINKTAEMGDADTADIYTGISRQIDMRLWFLEAHLQA